MAKRSVPAKPAKWWNNYRRSLCGAAGPPSAPGAGRERFLDPVVHEIERLREGGLYIQIGGVEQDGILGLAERRGLARAVALVARQKLRLDLLDIHRGCGIVAVFGLIFQLEPAPQ